MLAQDLSQDLSLLPELRSVQLQETGSPERRAEETQETEFLAPFVPRATSPNTGLRYPENPFLFGLKRFFSVRAGYIQDASNSWNSHPTNIAGDGTHEADRSARSRWRHRVSRGVCARIWGTAVGTKTWRCRYALP